MLVTINELKDIYGRKSSIIVKRQQRSKEKSDDIIRNEESEVDDIFQSEHDYSLSPALDCIIYYVTGYFFSVLFKNLYPNESTIIRVNSKKNFLIVFDANWLKINPRFLIWTKISSEPF